MEVLLVAREPVPRWALADALGVEPADAVGVDEGLARLLHPVGCAVEAVVVLAAEPDDVQLVARLVGRLRCPVAVLVSDPSLALLAAEAGPDVVADVSFAAPTEQAAIAHDALVRAHREFLRGAGAAT